MSRFDDIDLSQLGPLPLGIDTYEGLKQARLGLLVERLVFHGFSYDVDMLETDPWWSPTPRPARRASC